MEVSDLPPALTAVVRPIQRTLPPGLSRTQGGESTSGSSAMTASLALSRRLIRPMGSCVMWSVRYLRQQGTHSFSEVSVLRCDPACVLDRPRPGQCRPRQLSVCSSCCWGSPT